MILYSIDLESKFDDVTEQRAEHAVEKRRQLKHLWDWECLHRQQCPPQLCLENVLERAAMERLCDVSSTSSLPMLIQVPNAAVSTVSLSRKFPTPSINLEQEASVEQDTEGATISLGTCAFPDFTFILVVKRKAGLAYTVPLAPPGRIETPEG